jgi:hypothetical protein
MACRIDQIPNWQVELFEAWADAGFPDHFAHTIKRGKRRGFTERVDGFLENAKWWREQSCGKEAEVEVNPGASRFPNSRFPN